MSEDSYIAQQMKKRLVLWFATSIGIGIVISSFVSVPNPLPHPEYVPTIINGLVASMSILMGFTFFSITHFNEAIHDMKEKQRHHLISMIYLVIQFGVLFSAILIGYSCILNDSLSNAVNIFLVSFCIMCGTIMDMWIVSNQFTFE